MEFSRQGHWRGLPFPSPGDLPDPGIKPVPPALAGRFFTVWTTREAPFIAYGYPIVPALFAEKMVLFPFSCLGIFLENQLPIMWVYFWTLYSISLNYLFICSVSFTNAKLSWLLCLYNKSGSHIMLVFQFCSPIFCRLFWVFCHSIWILESVQCLPGFWLGSALNL